MMHIRLHLISKLTNSFSEGHVDLDAAGMVKDMSAQPSSPKDKKLPSLLRKGSSSRIPLKEKIVQLYEAFFRVSRGPWTLKFNRATQ